MNEAVKRIPVKLIKNTSVGIIMVVCESDEAQLYVLVERKEQDDECKEHSNKTLQHSKDQE